MCVFSVDYIQCDILWSRPLILMVTVGTSNERDTLPLCQRESLPVRDGRQSQGGGAQHTGGDQEGPRQGEGAQGEKGGGGYHTELVTSEEIDLAPL